MRSLLLLSAAALLAACGSNVPPMANEAAGSGTQMSGMAMPPPTGNQDRDFARMMIVHHQGAIDMARTQQARGSDPRLRQMAGEIIAAQQREIAELNAFLDRTGGR
nr:DUF305 domain-containing protein [uncultured Sphingomonas sp.]